MHISTNAPIQADSLVKIYNNETKIALNNISFSVPPGSVFGLLGPNGAGKTTLIKMILGLVLPTQGQAYLGGFDVNKQRSQALRQAGAVLEGARNIYWRLSARANLEYFGTLRGLHGRELTRRVDEVLTLVDLADRADEETRLLSRGMQQKVALAVSILHEPQALLLDEPTLGLDVQAARVIEKTIHHLTKDQGKTVLLTTHQMDLAERLCDYIFVINKGQKVAEGSTAQIIRQFEHDTQTFEIRLGCVLPSEIFSRLQLVFFGLSTNLDGENSVITWNDTGDQKELLNLLSLLDNEGFPILHAGRREATLEEVFVRLTSEKGQT